MRWTLPSWTAIVLGALFAVYGIAFGLFISPDPNEALSLRLYAMAGPIFIGAMVLLGAGLLSLQSSWIAWCSGGNGCGCCGDNCNCGDCGSCQDDGHHGDTHGRDDH